MHNILRKHLLSSVAFRPDDETGSGDTPELDHVDLLADDDETVADPTGETDEPEGDEPDGDTEGDDDEEEDLAAAAPRPSRGARQFAELRAERRRLSEENARVTRELDEMRRNVRQSQQQVESPEQEQARMALMSPEERTEYRVNRALAQHTQQQQHLTNQLLDQSDKASFDSQALSNPVARKLGPEVERRLASLRANGQNLPRSVVLTYLVGERAMAQLGKKKDAGRTRTQRETARPVRSRGDVAPDRSRRDGGVSALEKRLENQLI